MHPILLQFTPFQLRNHLFWLIPLFGLAVLVGRALMKKEDPRLKEWGVRIESFGTFFLPVAVGLFVILWIATAGYHLGWIGDSVMMYELKIRTYGVMMASGFVFGIAWAAHDASTMGLDRVKVVDAAIWVVVGGLIGAQGLYVMTRLPEYISNPGALKNVLFQSGFVWYGGLIGGFATSMWIFSKKGLPLLATMDAYAPGAILGLGLGRIGCLNAGCCHGGVCPTGEHWYTLTFPTHLAEITSVPDRLLGTPLYPTQPLETLVSFSIFGFLAFYRKRKKFHGQIMLMMIGLYALWRPFLEMLRGDKIRGYVIEDLLTTSQFISVLLLGGVIVAGFFIAPIGNVKTYKFPESEEEKKAKKQMEKKQGGGKKKKKKGR